MKQCTMYMWVITYIKYPVEKTLGMCRRSIGALWNV